MKKEYIEQQVENLIEINLNQQKINTAQQSYFEKQKVVNTAQKVIGENIRDTLALLEARLSKVEAILSTSTKN